jgi:hypothetical protein
MKLEFSGQIFEKYSNIKVLKIRLVGAELFHADGRTDRQIDRQRDRQTDMAKLVVAFRNFANAPENQYQSQHSYLYYTIVSNSLIDQHVST